MPIFALESKNDIQSVRTIYLMATAIVLFQLVFVLALIFIDFVASLDINALIARVPLMLALTKASDWG